MICFGVFHDTPVCFSHAGKKVLNVEIAMSATAVTLCVELIRGKTHLATSGLKESNRMERGKMNRDLCSKTVQEHCKKIMQKHSFLSFLSFFFLEGEGSSFLSSETAQLKTRNLKLNLPESGNIHFCLKSM